MGGLREEVIEALRRALEGIEGLRLACIFGSYARGAQTPASDVDVAVLAESGRAVEEARAAISKALGVPESKVSIVDLGLCKGPSLAARALKEGVVLLDRGAVEGILSAAAPEAAEVAELEAASLAIWLRGDPRTPLWTDNHT